MAAESENLDARMEAIRIKNEELEKKHKEIQEDEQRARKDGAQLDVKNSAQDLPKSHPYDNIDLDFDVKASDKELAKDPAKTHNRRPPPRSELLDEIPPDPVNFLREDSKEQGEGPTDTSQQQKPRINKNAQQNNRSNRGPRQIRPQHKMNSGKEDGDVVSPTHSRNNQRNHRSPKTPEDTPSTPQKRPVNPQGLREKRSVNQNDQQQQQNRGPRKPQKSSPTKEMSDLKNITVQISTDSGDGNEIRSVKLKTASKKIGSGRIGQQHGNGEKFTVDTFNPDDTSPPQQDKSRGNKNNQRGGRKPAQPKTPKEFNHPTLENIVVSKSSVQNRLARIAKEIDDGSNANETNISN